MLLEEDAVRRSLEMAEAGDLVVIFGDDLKRDWEQILAFAGGAEPSPVPWQAPAGPRDPGAGEREPQRARAAAVPAGAAGESYED